MADKIDDVLSELKQLNKRQEEINILITDVVELKIHTQNLTEWVKKYQDVQIPKCEGKFEYVNTNISNKVGGIYNRLWWIFGIFMTIILTIIGLVVNTKK